MAIADDYITLPSGRKFYANCNIIGINDKLDITEGYDGSLPQTPLDESYKEDDWSNKFTKEESIELADMMIARWQEFRKKCVDT